MGNVFLGLITQQWQSALRWLLTSAGVALASKGILSADQWTGISPLIEGVVGAIVALGSGLWSLHSNKASTIIKTADKLSGK